MRNWENALLSLISRKRRDTQTSKWVLKNHISQGFLHNCDFANTDNRHRAASLAVIYTEPSQMAPSSVSFRPRTEVERPPFCARTRQEARRTRIAVVTSGDAVTTLFQEIVFVKLKTKVSIEFRLKIYCILIVTHTFITVPVLIVRIIYLILLDVVRQNGRVIIGIKLASYLFGCLILPRHLNNKTLAIHLIIEYINGTINYRTLTPLSCLTISKRA